MEQEQTFLWIVAIVAVVGMVGMIVSATQSSVASNLSGDATAKCYSNTHYTYCGAGCEPIETDYQCCSGSAGWTAVAYEGGSPIHSSKKPSVC